MERVIKFRFWLGHTKKMTHAHTLQEVPKVIPEFTPDIITLQFTGLLDKDGKEIYEGDIISNGNGYEGRLLCWPVVWHIDRWRVQVRDNERAPVAISQSMWKRIKIIGNIYENPSLLS